MLLYLTLLVALPSALCAPSCTSPLCTRPCTPPLCTPSTHTRPCTPPLCTPSTQSTHTNKHFRVPRAVFDIIPTVDPTMGETGQQNLEERQAGDRCNCPDSGHMACFLDTKLKCRVSLQMEPDSSWATMKKLGTEATQARRGKFKKNKKKQLRKLFAKWLEQKKKENRKT